MANDKQGNPLNMSDLLTIVKNTDKGKKKADLSIDVTDVSLGAFVMEGDQVKVPRKRATSDQWPAWFEQLEAPREFFVWVGGDKPIEVTYNDEKDLFVDEDGNEYTNDHDQVKTMAIPSAKAIEGTPEALQQLRNAITRFNTKTGKKLATRFVKATRDSSGRTLRQTENVIRLK